MDTIDLIEKIDGNVVLSGIGKSGMIANKIAATLTSTGTSSFFLHGTEASHGDLGLLKENDILFLISNSFTNMKNMKTQHFEDASPRDGCSGGPLKHCRGIVVTALFCSG